MHDSLQQVIFYIFAGLALISALMVITQNNPVRCVLFLVLTFIASAVLWILAYAEFLALILVLVYVGAVMTLFLFVVMMLNVDIESMKADLVRYLPIGLFFVAAIVALLCMVLPNTFIYDVLQQTTLPFAKPIHQGVISNTSALGSVLYTDYVFAFELAAVILLVAIVAAISLAHRERTRSKKQDVTAQIMTRRSDRVTLVKMAAEK